MMQSRLVNRICVQRHLAIYPDHCSAVFFFIVALTTFVNCGVLQVRIEVIIRILAAITLFLAC